MRQFFPFTYVMRKISDEAQFRRCPPVKQAIMRISAKAEYACLAMADLARRFSLKLPTSIKVIAENYGMSSPFLMQIFLQLKGARLVTSMRGSAGGYQLALPPEEITLAEIVDAIDGPPSNASALSTLKDSPAIEVLKEGRQKVETAQRRILQEMSLADLLRQTHQADAAFYQI